jgi:hypothetical protein
MHLKNVPMRRERTRGTVRFGHADHKEVIMRNPIPMRHRISMAFAVFAFIISAVVCGGARADTTAMPPVVPARAPAPSYAPQAYHDSHWSPASRTSTEPAQAAKQYHDSAWRPAKAAPAMPTYAPKRYHDSYWPAAASDR